ncbi:MAG: peptide-methionine (S)-S-oxide reductase MsrA [Betaproteobacteria bacterium]|nr:peptide-methionine (S)-S-oxide reductase MsrA [Betaproteobacteria bacterium]
MEEAATFGGGCFWCLEAAFRELRGVIRVVSGYAGGSVANPTYQQVCTGHSGHAEVVQVTFDPRAIGYAQLLEVFFALHDPTTLNRQGNDVGTQYRSVIFYHSAAQHETARRVMDELAAAGAWAAPLVTELSPATAFYPAEDDHQDYFRKNPDQRYCQWVVGPKVAKLRARFSAWLRP